MDNQLTSDKTYEKFTWTIKNFSKLKTKKLYSENFVIGGHPWRILIFPKGNNTSYLSIYLDAGGDLSNLPNDWSRVEKFKLSLINQVNGKMTITKGGSITIACLDHFLSHWPKYHNLLSWTCLLTISVDHCPSFQPGHSSMLALFNSLYLSICVWT
ncbi:ubiquitin C-terminal hydrolase 12-like isoform X2 [Lotus japonicus]|uniref:ubiquitin C-terminal hydrolase 12-like isoform X2 n=1 Tax=Lotus japonicus TaxID=34305 RepID=UPI002583B299|nr:ubiquitin C-terminal hydrolase 12-like isoform X2 [Lotus japonicus]